MPNMTTRGLMDIPLYCAFSASTGSYDALWVETYRPHCRPSTKALFAIPQIAGRVHAHALYD